MTVAEDLKEQDSSWQKLCQGTKDKLRNIQEKQELFKVNWDQVASIRLANKNCIEVE